MNGCAGFSGDCHPPTQPSTSFFRTPPPTNLRSFYTHRLATEPLHANANRLVHVIAISNSSWPHVGPVGLEWHVARTFLVVSPALQRAAPPPRGWWRGGAGGAFMVLLFFSFCCTSLWRQAPAPASRGLAHLRRSLPRPRRYFSTRPFTEACSRRYCIAAHFPRVRDGTSGCHPTTHPHSPKWA